MSEQNPTRLQEALIKATEYEFCMPKVEEIHEQALVRLEDSGLERGNRTTNGYFNRKETTIKPIEWQVERSTLRIYPVLVTEVYDVEPGFELGPYDYNIPNPDNLIALGIKGLEQADSLTRIIKSAFCDAWDSDAVVESNPRWQYYETKDGAARFLRIKLGPAVLTSIDGTTTTKLIASHLKFYKYDYPKPYGGTKDAIPL